MLALLQLAWLGWLLAFPVALDSDDALNFAHGVVRFSVLEFSPHFPGYPAFIWLARLINLLVDEPARAVQWASLLGTTLLAPLAAYLAVRLWQRPSLLAPVWLLVLALPLTPTLALSGLSDGPALAAWLGALLALQQRKIMLAGLLLGLMLALRPSYFVLALLPLWLGMAQQGTRVRFVLPIVLVGLISLLFVWQADGWAYFSEGRRFTDGHFTLWGNTAAAHGDRLLSWASTFNYQLTPFWPLLMGPCWYCRSGNAQRITIQPSPLLAPLLARPAVVDPDWPEPGQSPPSGPHHPARPGAAGRLAAAPGRAASHAGSPVAAALHPHPADGASHDPGHQVGRTGVPGAGDPVGGEAAARNHGPARHRRLVSGGCPPRIGARGLPAQPASPQPGGSARRRPTGLVCPPLSRRARPLARHTGSPPSPKLVDWMFVTP